jgi:hypothetical protein
LGNDLRRKIYAIPGRRLQLWRRPFRA